MNKILKIILALVVVVSIVLFWSSFSSEPKNTSSVNNVSLDGGLQTVTINAKGGYSPIVSTAKADTPTVLKIATQATFDCSSSVVIPSLGIKKNLPPSGETTIEIPPQKAGTTLNGLCSMGMYNFAVNFN